MRSFLLEELKRWSSSSTRSDSLSVSSQLVVVCGKTGSGKTRVIDELRGHGSIDLEGLARHRGSAFGALPGDGQPSQIDFENSFIVALLRALDDDDDDHGTRPVGGSGDDPPRRIFVEDEGNRVGNVGLRWITPPPLYSNERM